MSADGVQWDALPQRAPRPRRVPAAQAPEPVLAAQPAAEEPERHDAEDAADEGGAEGRPLKRPRSVEMRDAGEAGPSGPQSILGKAAWVEGETSNFEYMDHTADIQLHSWGKNTEEAFAWVALALFNYMTPLKGITCNVELTRRYRVQAHDMQSLLFAYLDELLFTFSTQYFTCREIDIVHFDRDSWTLEAVGRGETFTLEKHEQGTEVKAITFSHMQIHERPEGAEIYCIVDI